MNNPNILWLMPPSRNPGEIPLVSQNRWFKYMPTRTNFIYPVLASYGVSMLLEAGFKVRFVDAPAENLGLNQVLPMVQDADLLVLEGRTAIMPWLFDLIRIFRDVNPSLQVVGYGDHVMNRPLEALNHGFDYVIKAGDWDAGLLALMKELKKVGFADPTFYWPNMTDLDHLPLLDRAAVNWKNYYESWRHREKFGWVQSGRGCFGTCVFCSWNYTYYHCKIRTMHVDALVREIKHAVDHYGITEFLDDADTFLTGTLGPQLAKRLIAENFDVFWNIQTRADVVARTAQADLDLMQKSGCHVVKLGVDGSNDETLARIQKGVTVDEIQTAVEKLKKAGLEIHVNMILGWPWETRKTAYQAVKFVQDLKPNQAQFGLIQPFIGTPLYSEAILSDWFVIDPDDYAAWDMKRPILAGEMSPAEIIELYRDAWRRFYFSPRYVARQLIKAGQLAVRERNLDAFRHLWRGYRAVRNGHLKVVQ